MAFNDETDRYRLLILRQSQILSGVLSIILSYFTFLNVDSQNQDSLILLLSSVGYCIIFLLSFQEINHNWLYRSSCGITLFLIGYFLTSYPVTQSPAMPWICVLPSLLIFFLDGWALKIASASVIAFLANTIYIALVNPQPPELLSQQHTILFLVSSACALGYSFYLSFALWNCQNKKHMFLTELQLRDPLTGVYNRRGLQNHLDNRQFSKGEGYAGTGLIMLDIDDFKRINDDFGHSFGDEVILAVSQRLAQNLREQDILVRYGGEEFMVFLENISEQELQNINNRLVNEINVPMSGEAANNVQVTVSGGSVFKPKGRCNPILDLINLADEKLYEAKNAGKNKILFCSM